MDTKAITKISYDYLVDKGIMSMDQTITASTAHGMLVEFSEILMTKQVPKGWDEEYWSGIY